MISPPYKRLDEQHSHPHRDAAVGNIEERKRPHLNEIRHESVAETVEDVGERAADNQAEADLREE